MHILMITMFTVALLATSGAALPNRGAVTGVVSKGKVFYFSPYRIPFNAGDAVCQEAGYNGLASVHVDDLPQIITLLKGAQVSKLWVNGAPKREEHCYTDKAPVRFNETCWNWRTSSTATKNTIATELWSSSARNGWFCSIDRAFFNVQNSTLEFEAQTNVNGYLCERLMETCTCS